MEISGIPAASTLHGLSAVSPDHPLYVGMLGMHGNYSPNKLTNSTDLILAVGMRFDDRVTGKLSEYAPVLRLFISTLMLVNIKKCSYNCIFNR